jgi:two-component sensor histidine kinase
MRGERIFIEHIFTFARTSVTLEILCSPTRSASRDITGAAFFGRDVTDLKGDDEGIKASLKEKEVLLKEVYHRVKNNLQLASSLLNFQGEYIKDKEALEMFRESQNRIKSMALVHEKLYESKDLARVDFADYVRNLVNNLMWSYGSDMRAIRLKVNVPEVFLHPKAAVPCGLIINELVSNAVKHAFPSQPSEPAAEIDIDFHSDNEDHYVLSVSDNGVGFPQGIDFRSTASLGLQLVVMLTEQLNGTVELDKNYDTGTRFIIRFGSSKA